MNYVCAVIAGIAGGNQDLTAESARDTEEEQSEKFRLTNQK
jgi:hypothetical protein